MCPHKSRCVLPREASGRPCCSEWGGDAPHRMLLSQDPENTYLSPTASTRTLSSWPSSVRRHSSVTLSHTCAWGAGQECQIRLHARADRAPLSAFSPLRF